MPPKSLKQQKNTGFDFNRSENLDSVSNVSEFAGKSCPRQRQRPQEWKHLAEEASQCQSHGFKRPAAAKAKAKPSGQVAPPARQTKQPIPRIARLHQV